MAQSTSGLLRRVTPALLRSLATKKTSRSSSLVYALLKTQQTAPERKRNASEADKQQANKEQTIVIRPAGGSTCPAATRLLGKPGLLHTSHSKNYWKSKKRLCVRLRSGDKHHLRKSADRKAQIIAFVQITGLICAFRYADFLRWCLSPERNLTHFFYFQ